MTTMHAAPVDPDLSAPVDSALDGNTPPAAARAGRRPAIELFRLISLLAVVFYHVPHAPLLSVDPRFQVVMALRDFGLMGFFTLSGLFAQPLMRAQDTRPALKRMRTIALPFVVTALLLLLPRPGVLMHPSGLIPALWVTHLWYVMTFLCWLMLCVAVVVVPSSARVPAMLLVSLLVQFLDVDPQFRTAFVAMSLGLLSVWKGSAPRGLALILLAIAAKLWLLFTHGVHEGYGWNLLSVLYGYGVFELVRGLDPSLPAALSRWLSLKDSRVFYLAFLIHYVLLTYLDYAWKLLSTRSLSGVFGLMQRVDQVWAWLAFALMLAVLVLVLSIALADRLVRWMDRRAPGVFLRRAVVMAAASTIGIAVLLLAIGWQTPDWPHSGPASLSSTPRHPVPTMCVLGDGDGAVAMAQDQRWSWASLVARSDGLRLVDAGDADCGAADLVVLPLSVRALQDSMHAGTLDRTTRFMAGDGIDTGGNGKGGDGKRDEGDRRVPGSRERQLRLVVAPFVVSSDDEGQLDRALARMRSALHAAGRDAQWVDLRRAARTQHDAIDGDFASPEGLNSTSALSLALLVSKRWHDAAAAMGPSMAPAKSRAWEPASSPTK